LIDSDEHPHYLELIENYFPEALNTEGLREKEVASMARESLRKKAMIHSLK
jgi:hypothetical protein